MGQFVLFLKEITAKDKMFITFQILANAKLQNSALHKIENHNDMKLDYELLMCNEVCAKVQDYFDSNFL